MRSRGLSARTPAGHSRLPSFQHHPVSKPSAVGYKSKSCSKCLPAWKPNQVLCFKEASANSQSSKHRPDVTPAFPTLSNLACGHTGTKHHVGGFAQTAHACCASSVFSAKRERYLSTTFWGAKRARWRGAGRGWRQQQMLRKSVGRCATGACPCRKDAGERLSHRGLSPELSCAEGTCSCRPSGCLLFSRSSVSLSSLLSFRSCSPGCAGKPSEACRKRLKTGPSRPSSLPAYFLRLLLQVLQLLRRDTICHLHSRKSVRGSRLLRLRPASELNFASMSSSFWSLRCFCHTLLRHCSVHLQVQVYPGAWPRNLRWTVRRSKSDTMTSLTEVDSTLRTKALQISVILQGIARLAPSSFS